MFELVERLERMAQINRDISVAAASAIASCDRLLELRADFNVECAGLLNNLTAMMVGQENGRMLSRLQHEVVSMHQMLGHHQRSWPIEEINGDPEGYLSNSASVHAYVVQFIEVSLNDIALSARPTSEIGHSGLGDIAGFLPAN